MIELTKDEAISLLKAFSMFEGFLLSTSGYNAIAEQLDYPIELLTKKLTGEK